MKNAKNLFSFKNIIAIVLIFALFISIPFGGSKSTAYADEGAPVVYYDDIVYNSSGSSHVLDNYQISYDEVEVSFHNNGNAPSLGLHENDIENACATLAGANIVTFYDRYFPDLLPNFEPGAITPFGFYAYYPDLGADATISLVRNLHNLMNSHDGTTEAEFRSGMQTFLSGKSRSISYQSIKTSSTSVDLNALDQAFAQNKVALLMCSTYNYVSSLGANEEAKILNVPKVNSYVGHMMVVYGYDTYDCYVEGELIYSGVFLQISSCYPDGDTGYIQLYDDLTIENAYIVTIS